MSKRMMFKGTQKQKLRSLTRKQNPVLLRSRTSLDAILHIYRTWLEEISLKEVGVAVELEPRPGGISTLQ